MSKSFVVDTSVLLYDIESLFKFGDNTIIIPSIVMEELDRIKSESSERGYAARKTIEIFDCLSQINPLVHGVIYSDIPVTSQVFPLARNLTTRIKKSYDVDNEEIRSKVTIMTNDHKIIACTINQDAILVTRDRSMRVMARDFVSVEDYKADRVKTRELYKGYRKVKVSPQAITSLYSGMLDDTFGLYPNEFIILENENEPKHTGIGIKKPDGIRPCSFERFTTRTKPLNLEQKMLLYLLHDDDIKCVSITGVSGKGKSLLAIDYALSQMEARNYNKFIYIKPITPVDDGEYLGYTKGTVQEKITPHLQPLFNSIEFLTKKQTFKDKNMNVSAQSMVDKLIATDTLEFCPLSNIRGMSILEKIVILDEGQNTTNHMMKSLVTRVADSSKLIILGDVEQIDDRNLNKFNNGLSHLIEEGKSEFILGHLCLDINGGSRRGKLSEFGSKRL